MITDIKESKDKTNNENKKHQALLTTKNHCLFLNKKINEKVKIASDKK